MKTSIFQNSITKWICLTLWPIIFLAANEQPYVTCRIEGQLGNQIFEIAAALAYAWDYNVRPIFPELNRGDWNIPLIAHTFFQVRYLIFTAAFAKFLSSSLFIFNSDKIPYRPDQCLFSYFQSWKLSSPS